MKAAVDALHERNPARLVVAVPVAPPGTCRTFRDDVDEVVCAATPRPFYGVGAWYRVFDQTSDAEVKALLDRRNGREPN
jgi:predicted phosphoribosyltransferase